MTGYTEWETVFSSQVKASIAVSNKTVVESAKEFVARVEKRTPIGNPSLWKYKAPKGYKPGTLRASWTLNYKQTSTGVTAEITNDAPYAERVEFGWSSQAPQGMLRITIKEWPDILNKVAEEYKI